MQICSRGGPRRSKGTPGVGFGRTSREHRAEGGRILLKILAKLGRKTLASVLSGTQFGPRNAENPRFQCPSPSLPATTALVLLSWVPEGSLAGFVVRRHLALDFVCGADFSRKLSCGAGVGNLRGSRVSESAESHRKTGPTGAGSAENPCKTGPKQSSQTALGCPVWAPAGRPEEALNHSRRKRNC